MNGPPTRRQLLVAAGSAVVAGCTGFRADDTASLPDDEDGTTLESVDVDAPRPRVDARNSGHVPIESGANPDRLAWSHDDSSTGVYVEPVLSDERLFYINNNRETVALDARSGELLWSEHDGNAFYPFAADEQHVYTRTTGDTFLVARDVETGDAVWRSDVAITETAPIPYDDSVYVGGHRGTLASLSSESGEEEWIVEVAGSIGQLAVDDSGVVAAVSGEGVERITHEGDAVWFRSVTDPIAVTLYRDLVVVATRNGTVVGLEGDTGDERWRYETDADSVLSTPTIVGDQIHVVDRDGVVHAVTVEGEQAWTWDTDTDGRGWNGELHNYEIAATNDWLYVLGFDEHVHVLDPDADSPEPVSRWDVGLATAPPLVVGDVAYLSHGSAAVRAVTLE
ncbi:outer membrane protein assembly factor BamB family protein [Natronobacterium texcoconense]|uniref:outer membrane protein assembly factor BamB family protein n=1 Tax=Natronobacterium texcoconense TaxID=1095778 RepID=UPI00147EF603|nr:PQQ-binding-like beta-propeller repeat protein [Natronobacterium texcoconense]